MFDGIDNSSELTRQYTVTLDEICTTVKAFVDTHSLTVAIRFDENNLNGESKRLSEIFNTLAAEELKSTVINAARLTYGKFEPLGKLELNVTFNGKQALLSGGISVVGNSLVINLSSSAQGEDYPFITDNTEVTPLLHTTYAALGQLLRQNEL